MKKKILIASILLSLTAIALVCTFIGCQERPETAIQQPADKPGEQTAISDKETKPISESHVKLGPPTEPSRPQDAIQEDENSFRL